MNQTCPLLDLHWVQLNSVHWAQWDPFSFPFTVSASQSCARHCTGYLSPCLRLPRGSPQLRGAGPGSGGPTLRTIPSRARGLGTGTQHMLGALMIAPPTRSLLSSELQLLSSHWPLAWKREGMCAGLSFLISKMEAWVFESSRRPLLEKKLIFFFLNLHL